VAQKIQTLFIDDINGSEAEGTVRFALDGADYEIDLIANKTYGWIQVEDDQGHHQLVYVPERELSDAR